MKKLSTSVNQTLKIGKRLARKLCGGEIILLSGSLGAGKTVLAKGIAQGLGINRHNVVSPTFVLLRIYKGKYFLNHFDFYRLKSPKEILGLGYEEYFYSDAVTLIEWPERLKFLLPGEFLKIKLIVKAGNSRLLEFTAKGTGYKQLLKNIYEDIRH
ncbi:MAG: tRNA (adenosine(37)-N6)-threonylcarbamoyltransferase complex ATPase subunit type 1 TsaE [Candidatus Omnitrophica bacterium]|nr:tRNA (adenosine(37)-N6)-threonylcarbamoyltransferase complex ATPase subunit type 1 TsaE [Candidatus Omnitrophota bacterium]MBU1922658.1 tRNA (adenosine(37)-N6)-threonylcarbamoyltransferase complex ATPase subunit type 1 TsaE [Candidatus Omnitrophota bacterium]